MALFRVKELGFFQSGSFAGRFSITINLGHWVTVLPCVRKYPMRAPIIFFNRII